MIADGHVDHVVHVIDSSGIVELLTPHLRGSRRGRKADPNRLRMFFVGMLLSIRHLRSGTAKDAHRALTNHISLAKQKELGVIEDKDGIVWILPYQDLSNWWQRINTFLRFDPQRIADGTATRRDLERHAVVRDAVNALLDVFDLGWSTTAFALDATSHESWARTAPPNKASELEDDLPSDIQALMESKTASGDGDQKGSGRRGDRVDPDARHGHRTARSGGHETFLGFHEHALVLAPVAVNGIVEPPLIRRMEVTPSNVSVVAVSLRMIDSLPPGSVRDLLVDRLYSHKKHHSWKVPLIRRGISQHHDLREDEQGFSHYQGMKFAAGRAHCPYTPEHFGRLIRPSDQGSPEYEAFTAAVHEREQYAFRVVNQPDEKNRTRVQCPARAGTVGCPLVSGTVEAMFELAQQPPAAKSARPALKPIIVDPTTDAEPRRRCCTQQTVTVTLPDPIAKLAQPLYWGSTKWTAMYNRRTYVEGTFGNRRNASTENINRGFTRGLGVTRVWLVYALSAVSYNMRMLQNWADRVGDAAPEHPLLTPVVEPFGYIAVDVSSAAQMLRDAV